MIGKIIIGKSFRGCISYCLEDKRIKNTQHITVKDRSEVLLYNLCYGQKNDLIRQFNDVRNLNPKLAKPVMHITLSFAAGEDMKRETLLSVIEDCAKDLGFDANQYIGLSHNDTAHQHIHIVANRIGFDAKTVKDSNNYQKISAFCRKMETKHGLQQVLSPRRFLSQSLRNLPRHDQRKVQLQKDITQCLLASDNYKHFEQLMKVKEYSIQRARGIVFYDSKKVRTKGSDVGYSLSKIEKILSHRKEQRPVLLLRINQDIKKDLSQRQKQSISTPNHRAKHPDLNELVYQLLKNESQQENTPHELLKKRKRQRGHHL
jgi:predicted site-specific integrase-resolvase